MRRYILSFPNSGPVDWEKLLGPWPLVKIRYLFESGKVYVHATAIDITSLKGTYPDLVIETIAERPCDSS